MNFDDAKQEATGEDMGIKTWTCCGVDYKIPLLNGDIEGQADLLAVADRYDSGMSGKPSELAEVMGLFMWEILKLKNSVDEKTARSLANKKTIQEVLDIWI